MSVTFLGLPNIAARGSALVTALGPEPTPLEAANLKTSEPSLTARITTRNPQETIWQMATYGDIFDFDGIALVNHNISYHGYFRVTDSQSFITIGTSSTLSSSNMTFASSRYGPTNPSLPWNFSVAFNQNVAVARQGEAMAYIYIKADGYFFSGADVAPFAVYPTIKVELRENGNLIRLMGRKAVTVPDSGQQIFIFTFNPAELSSPSVLADVEARVYGNPGIGELGGDVYFKINTIEITYDNAANNPLLESGWIVDSLPYFTSPRDGTLPTKSSHYLSSVKVVNNNLVKILILDDGTEIDPPTAINYGVNYSESAITFGLSILPDPFISAGMLIVGPKVEADPGTTTDSSQPKTQIDVSDLSGSSVQSYGLSTFVRRGEIQVDVTCTRDVQMVLMSQLGWQKGNTGVIYCILEPDLQLRYQLFSAFACLCTQIQSYPIEIGRTGTTRDQDMFLVTMTLLEKL